MFFKTLNNIKHKHEKAVLAFIFFIMLILTGCGKRKPPLPPVERVLQRIEISGFQRGSQVFVTWTMPTRNASEGSLINISRADIYRLTEPANSSSTLSEEEFASRSTLISTIQINEDDFARKQLTYTDTLSFAGQSARIRYAVRFANATGQKAGFSNCLVIEPTAKIAENPNSLKLEATQNAIVLNWSPPTRNIDDSTPANILGFNIYRIDRGKNTGKLLNTSPITANQYSDRLFEFEKSYTYFVRTVSLGANGEPAESADSEQKKITPKDTFAPAAPAALTIAATPSVISIFFATNTENDIAGYRVYRSTDSNLPKSQWNLLTPQLLTTNTFQDTGVESGKTYYYYLTAVDKFGNISQTSETVSETVP